MPDCSPIGSDSHMEKKAWDVSTTAVSAFEMYDLLLVQAKETDRDRIFGILSSSSLISRRGTNKRPGRVQVAVPQPRQPTQSKYDPHLHSLKLLKSGEEKIAPISAATRGMLAKSRCANVHLLLMLFISFGAAGDSTDGLADGGGHTVNTDIFSLWSGYWKDQTCILLANMRASVCSGSG